MKAGTQNHLKEQHAVLSQPTIYSVAADACDKANRTGRDAEFRYAGVEARATPTSCVSDVVEIWFWKNQFEKWKRAVGKD